MRETANYSKYFFKGREDCFWRGERRSHLEVIYGLRNKTLNVTCQRHCRYPTNLVKWTGQVGWECVFLSLLTTYLRSFFLSHEKKCKFKRYEIQAAYKTCENESEHCNLCLCVNSSVTQQCQKMVYMLLSTLMLLSKYWHNKTFIVYVLIFQFF